MSDDRLDEQPEATPKAIDGATHVAEPGISDAASPESPAWSAERVFDVTLGLAAVAADAAGEAIHRIGANAKALQENAPAIREALEERGRPIREQIVTKIRETLPAKSAGEESPAEQTETVPVAPAIGHATSPPPADQEIAALEQRVRELELQVSVPPVESPETSLVAVESGETTAESATLSPDEQASPTLAASEYAVSETVDEVAIEGGRAEHEVSHGAEWPFQDQGEAA